MGTSLARSLHTVLLHLIRIEMKVFNPLAFALLGALFIPSSGAFGQCSVPSLLANTCLCQTPGATNCDMLPDIMISWQALQSASSGPSEYSQTATSNAARLRVTGSTPNVGHGPLETRGINAAGVRKFICGNDTISTSTSGTFTCPAPNLGITPRQMLYQRIYHKNGSVMTYNDVPTGTMTYHASHGHQHVNDWSTMTLRLTQPGVSDARQWPSLASGGKVGYCLINLFNCQSSAGYCRTSHLYNQGSILNAASFGANYNMGFGDGCNDVRQGIKVGYGDTYSENLDGMWINLMPGLCNGQYQIVMDVDPNDDFLEENELNNYTWMPFTLSQQRPANSGGTANIASSGRTVMAPGETRTLTASPGTAYSWNTGATTRSITVSSAGSYSCTVTCPCGSLATPTLTLTAMAAPPAPTGTDDIVVGPATATLGATGSGPRWFDAASGGNEVGAGNGFNTPMLSTTTNYWVEDRAVSPGVNLHGGRTDFTNGAFDSSKGWLYFNAAQPFVLESFQVNAQSLGNRHFVLVDQLGNLIAEKFIEIPAGVNTITVNWNVPAGLQHQITAYDDNSEVVRALYRSNAGVTFPYSLGALGSITGSNAAGTYYYLYDWVVRTDDVVATSPRTMVTATVTDGVVPDLKVLLDGPYDPFTGRMTDGLRSAGLIPLTEPFTALGFAHAGGGGGETTSAGLLSVTGDNAVVDWVLVELRNPAQPNQILATRSALVTRIGQVISTTGSPVRLPVLDGNYYVALRHRNHMGCMTAAPVALAAAPVTIDFTMPSTATWGTQARKQDGATTLLWSGNALRDQTLLYMGAGNDRDPILAIIGGSVPTNTVPGYMLEDTNLDGLVKYTGGGNDRDLILANIGGAVPTADRTEQLP